MSTFFVFIIAINAGLAYYCGKKVYNYNQRGWIGLAFFSFLTYKLTRHGVSNIATMRTVINKVYINEDGKKIMFTCVGSLNK